MECGAMSSIFRYQESATAIATPKPGDAGKRQNANAGTNKYVRAKLSQLTHELARSG